MKKSLIIFLFFLMAGWLTAQQKTHTVQAKETVYGITKQYGVSQSDLENANPFLKERGLQIGDALVIPGKSGRSDGSIKAVVTQTETPEIVIPKEDDSFLYIEIKPKQTIYSLTKEYNISEEALKSLNPQLKEGLKAGDVVRIPKQKPNQQEETAPEGMYKVKKGDTIFTLAKLFNVSQDDFYIANPDVQISGLIVGNYIKIPVKTKTAAVIQDGFIEHIVKAGETIYSITKLYKVSFADLLKHNPELSEGLKVGMTLKIPLQEGAEIHKIGGKIKRADDNKISIAMILPFHLDDGSGKTSENQVATDLLIGAKLALDSLAYQGKKINLKVFDSGSDSQSLSALFANNDFSAFDAVVGPLFGSNFKSVAKILAGSGIAVVTPLSNSEDLQELENVIVTTPTDQDVADAIVTEVVTNYNGQKIQILTDQKNQQLADYFMSKLKQKLSTADISITKDVNQLIQDSTTQTEMQADGSLVDKKEFEPLITVLVSDNNQLGAAYVSRINGMDAENLLAYGVKFVSVYDIYSDSNKQNISILRNIGFTFSTNRLVNVYGKNERATIEKFMSLYCEIPNDYKQIGFDVLYDLVDRMNSRGDVLNNLMSEQNRLSSKFKYEKKGKAYVNTGVRTVRLFVPVEEATERTAE